LKEASATAQERKAELESFYAASKLEIDKLAASCLNADEQEVEVETARQTMVDKMERRKEYHDCGTVMSVSQLYDDILWSVASSNMGLSSTASNTYSDYSSAVGHREDSDEDPDEQEMKLGINEEDGT